MSYRCPLLNVLSMTSVKVGNLNPCTTTNSLRIIFQKYGEIGDVYIPWDCFTKKTQGFAFVHFLDKRHAENAVAVLDEIMVDGLVLRVHMAPPRYPLWQPWGKSCAQVLMTEPQPSGAKPIPISRHISLQPREVSINLWIHINQLLQAQLLLDVWICPTDNSQTGVQNPSTTREVQIATQESLQVSWRWRSSTLLR